MELDTFLKGLDARKLKPVNGALTSSTSAGASLPPSMPLDSRSNPSGAPHLESSKSSSTKAASREAMDLLKQRLHSALIDKLNLEELNALPEERRRNELRRIIDYTIDAEKQPLSLQQKQGLAEQLIDDMLGFGPLEPLLRDVTITDILINGARSVYVERKGVLKEEVGVTFRDNDHLLQIIQRIVALVGRRVNESSPMVDARLLDGSRFNAIIPPLAVDGPLVSIRRFGARPLRILDLLALKSVTPEMCRYLEAAVKGKLNLIVSGGTGSGKTTLLNALSSFIPATERIVTIEDSAELILQQRHVARLETRPPNLEGKGEVSIRDLLRNALRMRPNRIVIGECRGAEAMDMLQAMNTGHEGSLTTLHANSARDALSRLETMIMQSQLEIPLRAMRQQIAAAINVIVQVDRHPSGARRITSITEVVGMEQDVVTLQDLFVFKEVGVDGAGKSHGRFAATGVATHYEQRFRARGSSLPNELFKERVLLEA